MSTLSDAITGSALSSAEAAQRLTADGPNSIRADRSRSVVRIATGVLLEPMFILLIAAAAIYFILGDRREAMALAASLFIIIGMTIVQERRTDAALRKLKDLSSPRALVVRDGIAQRIAGYEVVVGDVLLLQEGDRVAADAIVLEATDLALDESVLTGESLPAAKSVDVAAAEAARVFSSTLVVRGHGAAKVIATGARTQIGTIGTALKTLSTEAAPLVREIRRIVRWVAVIAFAVCAAIAIGYSLSHQNWLAGILVGITMAMGILPEEFPVVLTVFLAMGAWRISKSGVLTRRMPAIETMGSTTVLAVDKTGTLTENHMRVAMITSVGAECDLRSLTTTLDSAALAVLEAAYGASEITPADPMERAIVEATLARAPAASKRYSQMQLVHEYEITPELLAVTHVWQHGQGPHVVVSKGAPETVFNLCRLDAQERAAWLEKAAAHAKRGLRVLAVAQGEFSGNAFPATPTALPLRLLGLVALADPLRANVPAAIEQCAQAGIRVIMITGDHPETALAIAREAGIDVSGGVILGRDLEKSDAHLLAAVQRCNVFARTSPAQKLRLVEALKEAGEIVGMTGDGVNDALALKAAHIGVAMGARGTDVAREAASLVLIHDEFASLVDAVRLGRRIYENLRHAIQYLLAVHIPIGGMGLLPVLLGWPVMFFPLHVLFLEFIIDPASCLVFEADAEDDRVMRRPPRDPHERLITRAGLMRSIGLGVVALAMTFVVYAIALQLFTAEEARALAFLSIICGNLMLIHLHRTAHRYATVRPRNWPFWWIASGALIAFAAVMHTPALAALFQFATPPLWSMLAPLLASVFTTSALDKALTSRLRREKTAQLVQRPQAKGQSVGL